jgi:HYD1 signature containing ADP-ribosyltransferase
MHENTALLPHKILKQLTVNTPSRLYHYTTKYNRLAIIESGVLHPSLEREDGIDALFGSGQYFTNIAPEMVVCKSRANMTPAQIASGQISLLQLFRRIMAGSVAPEKLFCYIEFDVSALAIESTQSPYIYLHRSTIDLSISNLIIRSGETLS